jgi:hypothetical protein
MKRPLVLSAYDGKLFLRKGNFYLKNVRIPRSPPEILSAAKDDITPGSGASSEVRLRSFAALRMT